MTQKQPWDLKPNICLPLIKKNVIQDSQPFTDLSFLLHFTRADCENEGHVAWNFCFRSLFICQFVKCANARPHPWPLLFQIIRLQSVTACLQMNSLLLFRLSLLIQTAPCNQVQQLFVHLYLCFAPNRHNMINTTPLSHQTTPCDCPYPRRISTTSHTKLIF